MGEGHSANGQTICCTGVDSVTEPVGAANDENKPSGGLLQSLREVDGEANGGVFGTLFVE